MKPSSIDFEKYKKIADEPLFKKMGKVINVIGLTIESAGPDAKIGDVCKIYQSDRRGEGILSEVVGFKDGKTQLMPYQITEGIGLGSIVENTGKPLVVKVSGRLLGKTLDGLGRPLDEEPLEEFSDYPIEATPPDPMKRAIIDEVLPLGVKAVDGLITIGKGQRIGVFAGSGVGKSTLLGMFA